MINKLVENDYFGEIGLIEQIPRTASVVTTSEAILYRVNGEQFLEIVSQAPALMAPLRARHGQQARQPSATEVQAERRGGLMARSDDILAELSQLGTDLGRC